MARYAPKQDWAVDIVRDNPGCTKMFVAERVGPNGSLNYGYQIVNRALANGRLRADYDLRTGRYSLFVND